MKLTDFNKNLLTLVSGTSIAQAIPILVTPILTRIYSPDDFGVFAIFASFCAILSGVANGRYELSILLPKNEDDSWKLFVIGTKISFYLAITILIVLQTPLYYIVNNNMGQGKLSYWLYLIPITVFMLGAYNSLKYLSLRHKSYRPIAISTVVRSISRVVTQLVGGILAGGAVGLILSRLVESFFGIGALIKGVPDFSLKKMFVKNSELRPLASKYKKFPLYSVPAALANSFSFELNKLLISVFYSTSILGLYDMVDRMLGAPSSLIGNSVGQVFYRESVDEKNRTGMAINSFKITLKKLIIIGGPIYVCIYFGVKYFFVDIFGEKWELAGKYALILIPYLFARFVIAPLSNLNNIFETQKFGLIWQVSKMIIAVGSLIISNNLGFEFETFLYILTTSLIIHHFIVLLIFREIARNNIYKFLK